MLNPIKTLTTIADSIGIVGEAHRDYRKAKNSDKEDGSDIYPRRADLPSAYYQATGKEITFKDPNRRLVDRVLCKCCHPLFPFVNEILDRKNIPLSNDSAEAFIHQAREKEAIQNEIALRGRTKSRDYMRMATTERRIGQTFEKSGERLDRAGSFIHHFSEFALRNVAFVEKAKRNGDIFSWL